MSENSFDARAELDVGGRRFEIFRLDALQPRFDVARLPFSLKILLENRTSTSTSTKGTTSCSRECAS
jgi:aconitate hydratase